jgi:hypothetical protein
MIEEKRLKRNAYQLAYYHANKDKALVRFKKYREDPKNKEKLQALGKKWQQANRDKERIRKAKWKADNPEARRQSDIKSRLKHRDATNRKNKISTNALRAEAIAAYGGHCDCCGEATLKFLSFDHINNDGKKDRSQGGRGKGPKLWGWLKRNGWPKGEFQLLCFNCNMAKMQSGECPHVRQSQAYLRLVS